MGETNTTAVYENNLKVIEKALDIIHSLELPVEKGAQKAYNCMLAGKEELEKESASELHDDKTIFLCAYTRDVADTMMATLFRLNKLIDQEELVKEYYALVSKEDIDRWAVELKQQHDAKQEIVKKQVEKQNKADDEMRVFQDILTGRSQANQEETTDGGSTAA